ncbi:hypothetical protein [Sphingomonas sp.]|uniref:hypothetical protein n=1 Tax=Sphingomonas sp. TaxID=28214 RepID=UPI003B0058E9
MDEDAPDGPLVWHYDGRSALRREAVLVDEGDVFRLHGQADGHGGETGPFAWADLIAGHADAGRTSYGLKGVNGWRLGFVDPPPAAVAAKLPGEQRYGRWVDRFGLWRASAIFACLAAITVAIVLRTPALVARLVPASVERRLGDMMVGDFGRNGCNDPAGQAALNALVRPYRRCRPDAGGACRASLQMVNAVTLPGGPHRRSSTGCCKRRRNRRTRSPA